MDIVQNWISFELDENSVHNLYGDIWIVKAVVRSLPPLAQQYAMRLLFMTDPVSRREIDSWVNQQDDDSIQAHKEALAQLCALRILVTPGEETAYEAAKNDRPIEGDLALHPIPQAQLRQAILSQVPSPSKLSIDQQIEHLEAHGQTRWDAILAFLVSASNSPPEWVPECLVLDGLMETNGSSMRLSPDGFQYLLEEPTRQVWRLMLAYVRRCDSQEALPAAREVLSLLCWLAFLTPGDRYPLSELTPGQKGALCKDLASCGIVYTSKTHYCTTPLGAALAGGGEAQRKLASVIMEKNFRVYIHVDTHTDIQVSLLSLFARMEYTLPNICAALLTRRSIFTALTHGVGVEAIIKFLADRAHPCMRNEAGDPCLPYNVCKQLRLWAEERERLQFEECTLLQDFSSEDAFDRAVEFAQKNASHLFSCREKLCLTVTTECAQDVLEAAKKVTSGGWGAVS